MLTSLEVTNSYFSDLDAYINPRRSISNLTEYLLKAKAAVPIFQEFLSQKNGVPSEQVCVTSSNIDAALLDFQPLTNQLFLEYYSYPTAKDLPNHSNLTQVKQDLIDAIELDCDPLLLESDPGAILNQWINQSVAL